MAIQLISGNLNTFGNNGAFETDPSTWGFGSNAAREIGRNLFYKVNGFFSMFCRIIVPPGFAGIPFQCAVASFPAVIGKKYIARAKVKIDDTSPVGEDNVLVRLGKYISFDLSNVVYTVTKTAATATTVGNNWVDIETTFEVTATKTVEIDVLLETNILDPDGDELYVNGYLYIDQFEVFEYEEIEEECTLMVDPDNTVVVPETGPSANDGSITVATLLGSGGTYEFKRSNDMGQTAWQLSNQFLGLDSGLHTIHVREQANPSCQHEHVFSVDVADITFDFTLEVQNESIPGANNGQITVNVTGTGGPFEFKLAGGAYQGPNIFPGLAPDLYYVTVKNAAGGILTKSAVVSAAGGGGTELPYQQAFFSKNPVTYQRQAAAGWEAINNYRIYNDVHVTDENGLYQSAMKIDLPPDSDGKVLFNVRSAFRDILKAIPPVFNNNLITVLRDRIRNFRHNTGELQDDEVTTEDLTESEPYLVLLGGLSTLKFPQIDFFGSYIQANKKFMTWAPLEKVVDRMQEDYLNFFVYAENINVIKLVIKAYYDDDTNTTATIENKNVIVGQLFQIPAGPTNSNVFTINPAKNLVKYDLWMQDQADAVISEVRTFIIAADRHPRTRFFMFLNSLGAYEVHRFTGAAVINENYDRTVIQKYLPIDYDVNDGEMEINHVTGQRSNSFSSGFFTGQYAEQWMEYMRDLVRTTRFYDVTSGTRVPMLITTGSIKVKEDQDYERYVRIDAIEAYNHESYTPDNI